MTDTSLSNETSSSAPRRSSSMAVVLLVIAVLVAVISGAIFLRTAGPPLVPLRVGLNAWPGYEFLYLAQEKNFYRDAGLDVRLIEFGSLSDCRQAYERGQIDVMGSTVIELLQICDSTERSPQIIRVADYSSGADVILTQPHITTAAALRGKRIGVEGASLGVYILARGLEKNGMNLSDVTCVSMDQLSMDDAFRKGNLDAMVTYPPTSIKILHDINASTVFSTAEISGEVVDIIVAEEELCHKQPATVLAFTRCFDNAVEYAAKNSAESYAIMAKREAISAEEFKQAISDGLVVVTPQDQAAYFKDPHKLATVIQSTKKILRQQNQLINLDRHIDIINADFLPE